MSEQGSLFSRAAQDRLAGPAPTGFVPDLGSYDRVIVCTSGGRDSTAAYLRLRSLDVPHEKIELHHHHVDGREGSDLFDWPVTASYVRRFAAVLSLKLSHSWRKHGFEGEMFRENALTQPAVLELADGSRIEVGGKTGKPLTRRKSPAVGPIRTGRYCSPILKIDPFARFLCHDPRLRFSRTLVVTGERAEESLTRRGYVPFKPHDEDARHSRKLRRHIDHWMPVHAWNRHHVWAAIREAGIVPHPCYYLGIGRCSCAFCVFATPGQLATLRYIDPERFARHVTNERVFEHTVHARETLVQRANRGRVSPHATPERLALAMSRDYTGTIRVAPELWQEPAGAFTDAAGPD